MGISQRHGVCIWQEIGCNIQAPYRGGQVMYEFIFIVIGVISIYGVFWVIDLGLESNREEQEIKDWHRKHFPRPWDEE